MIRDCLFHIGLTDIIDFYCVYIEDFASFFGLWKVFVEYCNEGFYYIRGQNAIEKTEKEKKGAGGWGWTRWSCSFSISIIFSLFFLTDVVSYCWFGLYPFFLEHLCVGGMLHWISEQRKKFKWVVLYMPSKEKMFCAESKTSNVNVNGARKYRT